MAPREAATTLVRLTLSVAPGFELIMHRNRVQNEGPQWKTLAEVRSLIANTPRWSFALAGLQWLTILALAWQSRIAPQPSRAFLAVACACIILPNVLPSLTRGQQIMVHQRQYPYVYSYFAFGAATVAFLGAWQRLVARAPAGACRQAALLAFAGATGAALISAPASNHHTLDLLQAWHNSSSGTPR
jgi:hypothetical protein